MAAKTDFFKIGQISGRQPVDVVGAVQKGISAGLQPFFEWQKKEKAWKESIAPKLAKIGEDYNPSLVDESQRSAMTAALQESRLKYADILKQVRNMDPTSEEYISLMGQATDIVAGFDTTFKNGQEFSKLGNEYALAAQKPDGLNRGMAVEKRAALGKIFIDKDYTIERNPVTGEMSYIINSDAVGKDGTTVSIKGLKISQDELDDFKLPNQDSVNKYLAQNEVFSGLGKQGEKLTTESAKYKSAAFQLQTELNNLDIEDLRSLALDPFIQGMPAAILDQNSLENIYDLTKEELAGKLQEGMLANLLATNQRDYKAPAPKGTGFTAGFRTDLLTTQGIYNNALKFAQLYVPVPGKSREQKTKLLVDELINLDPQSYAGKIKTRGEMYNLFLENSGAKDTEQTRNIFKRQYGDAQIYYDSAPLNINTDNPGDLTNLYLDFAPLGDDVKNYYKQQTSSIFENIQLPKPSIQAPTTDDDGGKKPTAPLTIEERADQVFNAESFSTKPLSISANLTRNEKFFINKLSETNADITEKDIAEAVYNSAGKQIITIFGKEYKPKALYEKDVKLQSEDQEDFKNLFNASNERVPIAIRNKYKDNDYLDQLNITDISQLTYKDIEKIKLLEKNISLSSIDSALAQAKFDSKKIS